MRALARESHEIPVRPSIQLAAGEQVVAAERDTRWPAFVFVAATSGEGWVPARNLSVDQGAAVVVTPYDTAELAVRKGDIVTVVERDDESGWWWCCSASGAEGWVPVAVLEVLGATSRS
jgi:uncharacterized protein (TIGR03382 family)